MNINDLDVVFTVFTLLLFITYEVRKYIKRTSKRPTFFLIDDIYYNIYDLYFCEIKSYNKSVKLDEIYATMLKMFEDASIKKEQIEEYITYLNQKSDKILYLPIITAITSFLGITNWESIGEVLKSPKSKQDINALLSKIIGNHSFLILVVLLIFMFILFYKSFSGDKLYEHIRESKKPVILTDYLKFNKNGSKSNEKNSKSNEKIARVMKRIAGALRKSSKSSELDLKKLEYAKNVLDFLYKNVSIKNKKLKVKHDEKIKVYKDNEEIEYNQKIPYSGDFLTVQYEDKQTSQKEEYSLKIQMAEDNRYPKIIPDSSTTKREFLLLCSMRNEKLDVLNNQLYNLILLGFFYKKIDEANNKFKRGWWRFLFTITLLGVYILMVVILASGSFILPIVFVVYFLSDFLISKIFE